MRHPKNMRKLKVFGLDIPKLCEKQKFLDMASKNFLEQATKKANPNGFAFYAENQIDYCLFSLILAFLPVRLRR